MNKIVRQCLIVNFALGQGTRTRIHSNNEISAKLAFVYYARVSLWSKT